MAPIFFIAWHVRKAWKEANQSDFGWEPFVSSYLKIVPIMVLLLLFWLRVCSMSCVQTLHINYHQLWQLKLECWTNYKMICYLFKVFRSHSFPLTWFGFSCQENFLQTYMGPIKFTIHWSQRQNLQIIVSLSRREK